jgi:tetratricopeptide (TPR) repeat protein
VDASLLMIVLVGFLPADDDRVTATVRAIERDLLRDGLLLRYPHHAKTEHVDGLPPGEGAFLPCTFWLADTYAQQGRHDEARRYYASALKIVPEEPSVLSNLGLSYVLSKDLPKAEETLRRAYASGKADARVRQNLGLVVGLQGRFAEAETIVKADLPAEEAAANVAYLKEMLSRKNTSRGTESIPVASLSRAD